MARPLRIQYLDAFYHVTSRGNERKAVYKSQFDPIEKAVDSALRSDEKVARQVKLHLCHRYSGRKLREIGSRYGMGLSGVTQASHRIGLKAEKDKKLGNLLKRIEKNILL